MDRREFFKKSLSATIAAAGFGILSGKTNALFAAETSVPDIVALKGGKPDEMYKAGIKAIGGMGRFVKKGQSVVVKPNIGWDVEPAGAANTNPDLVEAIIKDCIAAGASKVYVLDHTCDYWKNCYKNSGIEEAVKRAGGEIISASMMTQYQKMQNPNAEVLKKVSIHKTILESDVLINVPILKDHEGAGLSIAMKNLMGVVWDRRIYHANDLQKSIAEFCYYKKPDLNIVDAYRVLVKNGPRGAGAADEVELMKMQLISTDIVAIDAAATKIFGIEPEKVPYIKIAHDKKFGNMNLDTLNIKKINMS